MDFNSFNSVEGKELVRKVFNYLISHGAYWRSKQKILDKNVFSKNAASWLNVTQNNILDVLNYLRQYRCIYFFKVRRPYFSGYNIAITEHGLKLWNRYWEKAQLTKPKKKNPYRRLFGYGKSKGLTPIETKQVAYVIANTDSLTKLDQTQLDNVVEYIKRHSNRQLRSLISKEKIS